MIMEIVNWFQTNWVSICAAIWAFDQLLKIVAKITPWGWDDNLSDIIGKFIAQFLPKKP